MHSTDRDADHQPTVSVISDLANIIINFTYQGWLSLPLEDSLVKHKLRNEAKTIFN